MTEKEGLAPTNCDEPPERPTDTIGVEPDNSPSSSISAGGIFDGGFGTYRSTSPDEYHSLLTSGLVVLDTNTLLDLYRYHAKTRAELIEVFTRLKGRLWVPHHAMFEFFENRPAAINSHSEETKTTIETLRKNRMDFERGIRAWANRLGLPSERTAELTTIIDSAVENVVGRITEFSTDDAFENAEDTERDPVIIALSSILVGSVGDPLSPDELREAKKEAKQRIIDKRPPGWRDAAKRDNPEGDYLVWLQTLQEAKRRRVDVLFVTGDVKDDWWRKERGEVKGPLPELVHEMHATANVRLFMLRPGSLLVHAGNTLGVSVTDESVQDTQRVEQVSRKIVSGNAFGRDEAAWDELIETGLNYLVEVAKSGGLATYTQFRNVLESPLNSAGFARLGQRLQSHILHDIVERNYPETNLIITALVTASDSNEPREGFYSLAQDFGLLPRRTTASMRYSFWLNQVRSLHDYYVTPPKAEI